MILCLISNTLAFLIRQPNREDIINIVYRMYEKDGITKKEVMTVVDTFPNQGSAIFCVDVDLVFKKNMAVSFFNLCLFI